MKKYIIASAILFLVSTSTTAQIKMNRDSITGLEIIKSEETSITFENEIEYITKGTVVLLMKEEKDNLTLVTDRLTCTYDDSPDRMPVKLIMNGNVTITNAEITISSETCEIDINKNIAIFDGNVRYKLKGDLEAEGSSSQVTINMGKDGGIKLKKNKNMKFKFSDKK